MADYNINAITRRVVFTGSAGLGPYAFSFEILDQDDLAVYFNTTSLTITTDYTVTINANGTGSVNIVTGGSVPSTPTGSDQIIIVGARDIERVTDFVTAGDLLASSLNEQLDALTIFDQQLAEEGQRSMRAPVYDPALVADGGIVDMTLPAKADRAGRFLAFDGNGNPTATTNVGDFKGDWAASTVYRIGDLVRDTTDDSIYRVNTDHTSSGSLPLNTNTNAAYYDLFVDLSDINASEAAAAASATEAEEWASKTNGIVDGTDYSSKAYALGGTGVTNTSGKGAAKEWATTTGGTVDTSEYSSKEYAIGTTVASGSAKDWASQASGTVDGSEYSAKYYSGQASTSASNAATSETNASNSAIAAASAQTAAEAARDAALAAYDDFDDRYLGDFASNPTTDNDGDPLAAGMLYFNTTDDTMKVYTGSGWVAAYVSGTGFLTTTGGTMTGDITFGDNDKAIFGAGSDLQIYHDGSNSIINDAGTGSLKFQYGGTDGVVFDSSGFVGIGTSSPSARLHIETTGSGDALVVESTDSGDTFAPDIAIYRNTSTPADNDGIGLVSFRGRNDASQDVEYVQIVTGVGDVTDGSENGNFGIKTMVDGSLDNRFVIDNSGDVAMLNHASIGVNAPASTRALTVAGATDGSGSSILVCYNSSLASKFAVRDDGYITATGDIQVGGGVYLGGTGAANLLDDYEEGTWTPEITISSTGVTTTSTGAVYNKIGNFVYAHAAVAFASGTSTGSVRLFGLPFTSDAVYYSRGPSVNDFVDNPERYYMYVTGTQGVIRVGGITQGTGSRDLNGNDILDNNDIYFYFHIFYRTA